MSVMNFKDSDSDDDAIIPSRNSAFHSSLRNSGIQDLPNRQPMVRYSRNTESVGSAFEEFLSPSAEQSPSHHSSSSFSSHFRPFDALKQKRAKKKEERKIKKSRKLSNSMENVVDDKEVSVGSNENCVDGHADRCTSNSPPSESPRVLRKNSRTGPSIFKRAGRNKSKDLLIAKESSSKDPSTSPPPSHQPTSPASLVNGGGHVDKSSLGRSSKLSKRPSMLRSSSASHTIVSGPTLINKQPELSNFDLEGLVKPVDKNWTKSGYLWLRMKLPNNHYAWTHIVSGIKIFNRFCWCTSNNNFSRAR